MQEMESREGEEEEFVFVCGWVGSQLGKSDQPRQPRGHNLVPYI